jgi:hypothetical protein
VFRVENWKTCQHYKKRNPPWIKLHRSTLDDLDFLKLPIASRALAPYLWLLASESSDGSITLANEDLALRLRLILCGNTSSTFWKVTPMKNSAQALTPTAGLLYQICSVGCYPAGGTWQFSVAEPRNATLTAPTERKFRAG